MPLKHLLVLLLVAAGGCKKTTQTEYIATIHKYCWASGNYPCGFDTTYIDTVELIKEGSDVRFIYADDGINRLLKYQGVDSISLADYYFYRYPTGTNYSRLYRYADSFYIRNSSGGLGGGLIWDIHGDR